MLQRLDARRLERLARLREHAERRVRLGYPNSKPELKQILQAEQRALRGEPEPPKPRLVHVADPVRGYQIDEYQRDTSPTSRGTWRWYR
jgi:hypothetical protein